jgi:excisionase family DNA binding protein
MTRPRVEDDLLTPSEVASIFRVDPKTVARWAELGKVSSIRTLGGHRRYSASEIRRLLEGAGGIPRQRLSS